MSNQPIKVRDGRTKGHFWASNLLIRRDGPTLGVYGVAVYCALATYADNNTQDAYPSVATLAKQLGCSTRKVRYSLQELERLGWIMIERRTNDDNPKQNYSNIYHLLDTPDAPQDAPDAQGAEGGTALDAGGTAQGADELHSHNIHSEKDSSPDADAPEAHTPIQEPAPPPQDERPAKKRAPDVLFDTVAARLFHAEPGSPEVDAVAGRVGRAKKALRQIEATLGEFEEACAWWERTKGIDLPKDAEKIAGMVLEFRADRPTPTVTRYLDGSTRADALAAAEAYMRELEAA